MKYNIATKPAPVPEGPGVYTLVHARTKTVFVGETINLRKRSYEWACAITCLWNGRGPIPRLIGTPFPKHPVSEWVFAVVQVENPEDEELRRVAVSALYDRAKAQGLNALDRRSMLKDSKRRARAFRPEATPDQLIEL